MENVLWENWSNWKFETADDRMQTGLYRLRSESKLLITKTSWLSFAAVLYKSTMTQTNPLAGRSVSVWACEDQFILRDSFSISFPTFHEPLVTNEPVCKFAIFGNNLSIDSAGSVFGNTRIRCSRFELVCECSRPGQRSRSRQQSRPKQWTRELTDSVMTIKKFDSKWCIKPDFFVNQDVYCGEPKYTL